MSETSVPYGDPDVQAAEDAADVATEETEARYAVLLAQVEDALVRARDALWLYGASETGLPMVRVMDALQVVREARKG